MPQESEIGDGDLLKWADAKMRDDFQLAVRKLSDTPSITDTAFSEQGKLRFDVLRRLTPPGRDPKIPDEIEIYPEYDRVPPLKELHKLADEIQKGGLTVWSECPQVGALWTLLEIKRRVEEQLDGELKLDHHFTTGHELVQSLSSADPGSQPKFAVITCAPVHLYGYRLPYRFMNPIHLEKQFFLRKGPVPQRRGSVFQLFYSTAEACMQEACLSNEFNFLNGFNTTTLEKLKKKSLPNR